jgi:hypothetical protein
LFDEAIAAFRPAPDERNFSERAESEPLEAHVLLDFAIPTSINCGEFSLSTTRRVDFPGAYAGFIAPVSLPRRIERYNGHLFAVAVSAVVSFTLMRPAKSPRDDYLIGRALPEHDLTTLGLQFPVRIAGPGSHNWQLSVQTLENYSLSLSEVTALLYNLPHKDYIRVMRAIRLVQLAHNNVRDDFSLAYYLLVSAIETIAQKAVAKKEFAEKHPQEEAWKSASKNNPMVKELLTAYRDERGKTQYLRKRFVKYILDYCPPSQWSDLEHPMSNLQSFLQEIMPTGQYDHLTEKEWDETYPSDLPENSVTEVLSDLYKYRSRFTHEGAAPPNRNPTSYNRYFDKEMEYDQNTGQLRELLLPNFRLISFIAHRSILNFARRRLQAP